jgi:hypothetical protein
LGITAVDAGAVIEQRFDDRKMAWLTDDLAKNCLA